MDVVTPDVAKPPPSPPKPDTWEEEMEKNMDAMLVRLLVKRRVERVNEALLVEWGDLECITGREILLKNCLQEEYEAVLKHFGEAGWKIGFLDKPQPKPLGRHMHYSFGSTRGSHPYKRNLRLVFCPPSSHMVGKVKKARDAAVIYRNPYSEPRYMGGEDPESAEGIFKAALHAPVGEEEDGLGDFPTPAEGGAK